MNKNTLIFLSGAPCSGKTTMKKRLRRSLGSSFSYRTVRDYIQERGFRPPSLVASADFQEKNKNFLKDLLDWQLVLLHMHSDNLFLANSREGFSVLDRSSLDSLVFFLFDIEKEMLGEEEWRHINPSFFWNHVWGDVSSFLQNFKYLEKNKEDIDYLSLTKNIKERILKNSFSRSFFHFYKEDDNFWTILVYIIEEYIKNIINSSSFSNSFNFILNPVELEEDSVRIQDPLIQDYLHQGMLTVVNFFCQDFFIPSSCCEKVKFQFDYGKEKSSYQIFKIQKGSKKNLFFILEEKDNFKQIEKETKIRYRASDFLKIVSCLNV
jgi:hypothetical protein